MKINLRKLIKQMTLEEKIGQMTQFPSWYYSDRKAEISGPASETGLDNDALVRAGSILGTMGARDVIEIQDNHLKSDRNKIPMLFMGNVIHGFRTIYPIPLGLACSFDAELTKECSEMASRESYVSGIHVNFGPMVDCARDPRWGRVMESFGEDPYLSSIMGAVTTKAFRGDGDLSKKDSIAVCVKHFAAYGGAEAGRDYNSAEISEHVLREYYLPAYKACIDAGADMVMPAFNNLNGVPCVANSWLMKKILRKEWGFKGIVITDYEAVRELLVHGVAKDKKEAATLAFENGTDIEMVSDCYHKHLAELIKEGRISEKELDKAVYKILKLKKDMGLFENPYGGASVEKEKKQLLTSKNRELARKSAEESAVLLKNDGTLPFSMNTKKVVLIGPFAESTDILGNWKCSGRTQEVVTVEQGIRSLLPNAEITVVKGCGSLIEDTDTSGFKEAVNAAESADAVILCIGEPSEYTGEGCSRADISLPGVQLELAKKVLSVNKNTAVLLFTGRPLLLTELDRFSPAILNMWFPGTEGGNAAANLLFGKANPCGKLSMTFPRLVGQCPIYYNYPRTGRPKLGDDNVFERYVSNYIDCPNLPLYFFGQGLSYTTFEYESMTLSKKKMNSDSHITVTVKVKNSGKYPGKETVMLYLCDLVSSTVRPIQELVAFEKIHLNPNESKAVKFKITEPMLRLWNTENKFVSERGEFRLSVGYADHIKFTETFILD